MSEKPQKVDVEKSVNDLPDKFCTGWVSSNSDTGNIPAGGQAEMASLPKSTKIFLNRIHVRGTGPISYGLS